jgi:ubiquinol oxidase
MTASFTDIGAHHKPKGASDGMALGFTMALRGCAYTFFAVRLGHRAVVI